MPPDDGERSLEYALFSQSRFRSSVKEAAVEQTDITLFSIEDVVDALTEDTEGTPTVIDRSRSFDNDFRANQTVKLLRETFRW